MMTRRRSLTLSNRTLIRGWVVAAVFLVGAVSGCSPDTRELDPGFGPSDIEYVEIYSYAFSDEPSVVMAQTFTDRVLLDSMGLLDWLVDLPVSDPDADWVEYMVGQPANGLRFVLRDGSTYEVTIVLEAPGVVLIWPDGQVAQSEFGATVSHSDYLEPPGWQRVDAEDRPVAEMP